MKNDLVTTLEDIMKDYGGDKWSKVTLKQFSEDVNNRIITTSRKLKGPQKLLCTSLLNKLKKNGSVQDQLLILNECYFSLVQPEV